MKKWFVLLWLVVATINCNLINTVSERKNNDKKEEALTGLIFLAYPQIVESNHALYRYVPANDTNLPTTEQFVDVAVDSKSTKPKLILVHGWDASEKSTDAITGKTKKVENINATWQYAFKFYNANMASVQTNYDLYAFTYRTANTIASNGERLINLLNHTFSKEDQVIIIAHSMGGLVSRAAIYHGNNSNDVIDTVVTLATPYYGSPYASSQYQAEIGVIGDLASFLVSTEGGKNLAHTNNGNGQTTIDGATNTYLDSLNANTDKNDRFYPYAGVLSSCSSAKSGDVYSTGCSTLKTKSPAFNQNDGIVPYNSAKMADRAVNFDALTMIEANFDHSMMSFNIPSDETLAGLFFTEVIQKIDSIQTK